MRRCWGVVTPHMAARVLPPKALLDPTVGEACAYVQGESLKAQAALHVRLTNSPDHQAGETFFMEGLNWARIIWMILGIVAWLFYGLKQKPWRTSIGAFVLWMILLPIWLFAGKVIFDY